MKVALFGYYGEHNFGDDLMAVIFGRFLRQCNIAFSVYKLHDPCVEPHGGDVAESLESLLCGADIALYGGGGVLCDVARTALYQAERRQLVRLANQMGIPLYGCSVGGDGRPPTHAHPYLHELLHAFSCLSVRNVQDVQWVQHVNPHIRVHCFPDIVWLTSAVFPRQRKPSGRLVIGVDIHAAPFKKAYAIHVPVLLSAIARIRRDIDFVIFGVRGKQNIARLKWLFGQAPNIHYHQFDRLDSDVAVLSSLDLLVSTRLHTGVVCLSYGIPFISLYGAPKTKLLLDSLGMPSCYYGNRNVAAFCAMLTSPRRLTRFLDHYPFPEVASLQRDSRGHFEMLKRCLLDYPPRRMVST